MGKVTTDTSQWPIVIHTNEGAMGPEETQVFLDALSATLERKQRYVCVIDSSKLSTFKMGDRDRIVQWLKANDSLLRKHSIGTGVVLASAALRFVISSVLLVYSPASPMKVFATLPEALAWARARVQTDALRASAAATA